MSWESVVKRERERERERERVRRHGTRRSLRCEMRRYRDGKVGAPLAMTREWNAGKSREREFAGDIVRVCVRRESRGRGEERGGHKEFAVNSRELRVDRCAIPIDTLAHTEKSCMLIDEGFGSYAGKVYVL